ncbi:MAG: sporulation initiation factor Spo0A C-terminal domain-containing protein [Ruminococcus sp.]|nr:sporulation initiation factor Spo0A C-terminal domain-containing protein [Ruminococcus sp.]
MEVIETLETACDKGDFNEQNSFFGYTIDERAKPTNSEFVALIADRIRIDLRV